MELVNFLKVITRHISLLGIFIITGFILSFYLNNHLTPTYQSKEYITIAYKDTVRDYQYAFNNFFGEYSSNNFTSTVLGWFKNDTFINQIISNFQANSVFATKIERSNFVITARSKNQSEIEKLANNAIKNLQEKVTQYNKLADTQYSILLGERQISANQISKTEVLFLSLISSLFIAIFLAYFFEFITGKIQTNSDVEEIFSIKITDLLPRHFSEQHLNFIKNLNATQPNHTFIFVGFKKIPTLNYFVPEKSILLKNNYDKINQLSIYPLTIFINRGKTNKIQLQKLHLLSLQIKKQLVIVG